MTTNQGLKAMLEIIFQNSDLPSPNYVRFYNLNLDGFNRLLDETVEILALSTNIINVQFILNVDIFKMYALSFLKVYLLITHWDIYQQYDIGNVGRRTLRKVKPILSSPIPKFILSAVRELARPMVSSDGLIFYPRFDDINIAALPNNMPLKNNVLLGNPDAYLQQLGFLYYPRLSDYVVPFYGEQPMEIVTGREGLAPCKMTTVATWSEEIQTNYETIPLDYDVNDQDAVDVFNDTSEIFELSINDHIKDNNNTIFITDLEISNQNEATRDLAARILQPYIITLPSDPRIKYAYARNSNSMWWPDVQIWGADVYRGQYDISISYWQLDYFCRSRLENQAYFPPPTYLNLFFQPIADELQEWQFPSLGTEKGDIPDRPLGNGPNRRKQRRKRNNNAKNKIVKAEPTYPQDIKTSDVGHN